MLYYRKEQINSIDELTELENKSMINEIDLDFHKNGFLPKISQ